MHLINIKVEGYDLPDDLPEHLVPPSKKKRMLNGLSKKDSFWRYSQLEQEPPNSIEPELAITLDFNVKSGSVVKKTSLLKEPSLEHDMTKRTTSNKFSSRESSMVKEHDYANDLVKGLETMTPLAAAKKDEAEKIHTLRYSSGGVLPNKPAQAVDPLTTEVSPKLTTEVIPKPSLIGTSDLPYIDESDLELDEAIRDAIGMEQDRLVTSIQLASTAASYSNASTLLVSQRSCSGTDTIHMSEKVIKRDYRDL